MLRKTSLALAATAIILIPACAPAQAAPGDARDKAAIEKIVHDYILKHPEIIEEALIALTEKERADQAAFESKAIADNAGKLYSQATDFRIGSEDAKVKVVEFFDYRCGYCKRSIDWINKLPSDFNGDVQVIYKELPIFGGISETASLAALAAGEQGKYAAMHTALMGLKSNNELTDKKIDELARGVGVNVQKMRADMRSTSVQKQLSDSKALARQLGVEGTPAFFIGGEAIKGADEDGLKDAIEDALNG